MDGAFFGAFAHIMDAKGRAIVPNAFREKLGESFTVRLNSDATAIAVYPDEIWQRFYHDVLLKISPTDIKGQNYLRQVTANTYPDCELDGQGRVLLPASLRQVTAIDKNLRFVGMVDHFEIWDEVRYVADDAATREVIVDLAGYVNEKYG